MASQVSLPKLTYEMEEGHILEWLCEEGEEFEVGQPLFVVETDKAAVEVPAEQAGDPAQDTGPRRGDRPGQRSGGLDRCAGRSHTRGKRSLAPGKAPTDQSGQDHHPFPRDPGRPQAERPGWPRLLSPSAWRANLALTWQTCRQPSETSASERRTCRPLPLLKRRGLLPSRHLVANLNSSCSNSRHCGGPWPHTWPRPHRSRSRRLPAR